MIPGMRPALQNVVGRALFAAIFAAVVSVSTDAQGTINFNNRVSGQVDAPVSRPDGTGAGPSVNAQLYWVQEAAGSLTYTPLHPATTFRDGSERPYLAYYVIGDPSFEVPGTRGGNFIRVVLRAWEGPSFEAAAAGNGSLWGQSNVIGIHLGEDLPFGVFTPALLVGLQGFTLVPEPRIVALVVLGGAVLIWLRMANKRDLPEHL